MKDYTQVELEESRPLVSERQAVMFCLQQLYADREHTLSDYVVDSLTYEELIGTLLLVRDRLKLQELEQRRADEDA